MSFNKVLQPILVTLLWGLCSACGSAEPTMAIPTAEFGMNESIEGNGWRITVLSAENKGSQFVSSGQTLETNSRHTHLLQVRVGLERLNGEPIQIDYLHYEIRVRDNRGNTYPWRYAAIEGSLALFYFDREKETNKFIGRQESKGTAFYIFPVPDNADELDLLWVNLPPVRLMVE